MELFDKAVGITWLMLTYQQNRILARGNPPQDAATDRLSSLRQRAISLIRYWPTIVVLAFGGIYFGRSLLVAPPQPQTAELTGVGTPTAAPIETPQSPENENAILAAKGLRFSANFAQYLSRDFLPLPRPCMFKLVAPKALAPVRDQLVSAAMNSSVPNMENSGGNIIQPCEVEDERKDRNPELYGRRDFPSAGMVIHTSDKNITTRTYLAALFGSQSIPVTGDSILPSGSPENLIYIEIGRRLNNE
jgi:hypothetical protein